MKTEGKLQQQMRRMRKPLVWLLMGFIVLVFIWTPLAHEAIVLAGPFTGFHRTDLPVAAENG